MFIVEIDYDGLVFQPSFLDIAKLEAKAVRRVQVVGGITYDFEIWVEKFALSDQITDIYGYAYVNGEEVQLTEVVRFVLSRFVTRGWWIFKWRQVEYYDFDQCSWMTHSGMLREMDED